MDHSPGIALALGFIPGVGAIYNGQIMKAIIEVLLFGSLCALSGQSGNFGVIFGLGAAAFYCFMIIDAYRVARRMQLGQSVEQWPGFGDVHWQGPIIAGLLILLGVLFLLDNLGVNVFDKIGKFWPVLLIAFGVLLFWRMTEGRNAPPGSGTGLSSGDSGPKTL